MGKNVQVLDPGPIVAASLKNYLERHPEIKKELTTKGRRVYLTTDDPKKFAKLGSEFLDHELKDVRHVDLGNRAA